MSRSRRRRSGPSSPAPRRFPGWLAILIVIAAATLAAAIPYAIASRDALRPPTEAVPVVLPLPPGTNLADLQQARVAEVIDGDTISVVIGRSTVVVRYFGVDTPERGERCYREAVDRNQRLLGETVYLLPDRRLEDRFGRLLRYVFLPDGVSLDATLVAEGFGVAWRVDGRYRDEIVALEDEARAAGRGCLWRR